MKGKTRTIQGDQAPLSVFFIHLEIKYLLRVQLRAKYLFSWRKRRFWSQAGNVVVINLR